MSALYHLLVLTLFAANALAGLSGGKIIHGKKARDGSLEYMASVQINGTHKCGGFLIDPNFVLTAAHCNDRGDITVILGTHNINGHVERHKVQDRIEHELYKHPMTGNDIMLLKLTKKVKLGKGVRKIEIPRPNKPVKASTQCLVAGWGITENKIMTGELRFVNVKTIDINECRREWKDTREKVILPTNVICAGGYKTKKGACQGDSGGPLVCNNVPIGIVSFNYNKNCNYPNAPNIYTQISKFTPWIWKHVKKATLNGTV